MLRLEALRVVVVGLGASRARDAGCWASVADTATLSVLGDGSTAASCSRGGWRVGRSWVAAASRGPDCGSRCLVLVVIAVIDVPVDAKIAIGVCTWEGVSSGKRRSRSSNVDLDARGIELSTTNAVLRVERIGLVQANDFSTEEIVSSGNVGDGDGVLALVGEQPVDSPLASTVSVRGDLQPNIASTVGASRCDVDHDWTLVRRRNDIILAAVVIPFESELVTRLDVHSPRDDTVVDIAGNRAGLEILERIVRGRGTNVLVSTVSLINAVNPDGPHTGVSQRCSSEGEKSGRSCELHGGDGSSGMSSKDRTARPLYLSTETPLELLSPFGVCDCGETRYSRVERKSMMKDE